MVVKEVIAQLIGDGRIESDKIGAANFYWLFPSFALDFRKRKHSELTNNIESHTSKIQKLEESIEKEKEIKEETVNKKKINL
jgi:hypothetical protein